MILPLIIYALIITLTVNDDKLKPTITLYML